MEGSQVPLPLMVERMIGKICFDQAQPPPDGDARKILASIGEEAALHMLKIISQSRIKTFTGYIKYLSKKYPPLSTLNSSESAESLYLSPSTPPPNALSSSSAAGTDDYIYHSPVPKYLVHSPSSSLGNTNTPTAKHCSPSSISQRTVTPVAPHSLSSPCSSSERSNTHTSKRLEFSPYSMSKREITPIISEQWLILMEIEFRKIFLVLNYIGRKKLEEAISVQDALKILEMKDYSMQKFEAQIWSKYGSVDGNESMDRRKYLHWDCGKTHHYYCHVWRDGTFSFKGPYLKTTKTLLHRTLGDENVLIVKFEEQPRGSTNFSGNCDALYAKIAEKGILIGQRRYRFFVFKAGDRRGKKKNPIPSEVNCYFIRIEFIAPCDEREPYILSNKTMHEARCFFMHLHTTPSMAKYASRCSLVLSQTLKLEVDLNTVHIETIEDLPCQNEYGIDVCNEDGDLLIHTDGTGFISEDLVMKCPSAVRSARYLKNKIFEFEDESSEGLLTDSPVREPPLLMQCRLFYNGCAVKGTLLVNRKIPAKTIQIRPSMIKVEADLSLRDAPSVKSLEVVNISRKPARIRMSKYLIALLNFGGVPEQFFLDILKTALEDSRSLFFNKHSAVRASMNYREKDDDSTTARMLLSGIPLDEPCVQRRLYDLAIHERKGLREGRLPITESFFLMGTADPTGLLNRDQICVILDNGQVSGKVLVYRYPGLHFGDIHVLNAVYLKELEDVVGNAKYGIFFSTKGPRSVASEIANGDFDGDIYWVSRNNQLLNCFKESEPWTRIHTSPKVRHKKPSDFPPEELENELFELFLNTKNQNIAIGVAADSWLAFMDHLLTLGDGDLSEKNVLKEKILNLIDLYYDALDAPKTGQEVKVPNHLKAVRYPHHMEKNNEYHSSSVLGKICDTVEQYKAESMSTIEIRKIPCFENVQIPDDSLKLWKKRYDDYRHDMATAISSNEYNESDTNNADVVVNHYKEMLYGAADFEGSSRNIDDIYVDALALYHVCYDFAKSRGDVGKCNFVWKVAGPALCHFHATKAPDRSLFYCLPSVLKELFN